MIKLHVNIDSHEQQNFTALYEKLLSKFADDSNCPAIILLDDTEPMICRNSFGDSVLFLNRNSDTLLRDFKKTISKKEIIISEKNEMQLETFWSPECNYGIWYNWIWKVCKYLEIDMPAIYIVDRMPDAFSNLSGVVLPGNRPYATDIFIRLDNNIADTVKTCIHELRHVWQYKYHDDWFDDYHAFIPENREAYYMQTAEIDADAFAYWVLESNGIRFHLEDLGLTRSKALRERMGFFREMKQLKLNHLIK